MLLAQSATEDYIRAAFPLGGVLYGNLRDVSVAVTRDTPPLPFLSSRLSPVSPSFSPILTRLGDFVLSLNVR